MIESCFCSPNLPFRESCVSVKTHKYWYTGSVAQVTIRIIKWEVTAKLEIPILEKINQGQNFCHENYLVKALVPIFMCLLFVSCSVFSKNYFYLNITLCFERVRGKLKMGKCAQFSAKTPKIAQKTLFSGQNLHRSV